VAVRTSGSSTARDAAAAQTAMLDFMGAHVAAKEADPSGPDMVSAVIRAQLAPGKITREQLVAHCFLLLVAGNATVARRAEGGGAVGAGSRRGAGAAGVEVASRAHQEGCSCRVSCRRTHAAPVCVFICLMQASNAWLGPGHGSRPRAC
jgi:hypothetical protein